MTCTKCNLPLVACVGAIGTFFGHKFESFEVERIPPQDFTAIGALCRNYRLASADVNAIETLTIVRSVVRCSRCGETK